METDVIDQPVEVTIMEVVGEALKAVVDQLNVRLSSMQADLEGVLDQREAAIRAEVSKRCDQLEKLIAAQAPRDVIAEVVKAIKAIPAPEFTIHPEVNVKSHVQGLAEALKALPTPEYTIENTFAPKYVPPNVVMPTVNVPDFKPQITMPELKLPDKFVLEMPERKEHKDISYDSYGRPVSIDTIEKSVKED